MKRARLFIVVLHGSALKLGISKTFARWSVDLFALIDKTEHRAASAFIYNLFSCHQKSAASWSNVKRRSATVLGIDDATGHDRRRTSLMNKFANHKIEAAVHAVVAQTGCSSGCSYMMPFEGVVLPARMGRRL